MRLTAYSTSTNSKRSILYHHHIMAVVYIRAVTALPSNIRARVATAAHLPYKRRTVLSQEFRVREVRDQNNSPSREEASNIIVPNLPMFCWFTNIVVYETLCFLVLVCVKREWSASFFFDSQLLVSIIRIWSENNTRSSWQAISCKSWNYGNGSEFYTASVVIVFLFSAGKHWFSDICCSKSDSSSLSFRQWWNFLIAPVQQWECVDSGGNRLCVFIVFNQTKSCLYCQLKSVH